ncbi:Hpt domain-containing protein [Pacificibacter marinus]|uniref:Hpt domain-containing protein n=1 Tax=Pacificibacter marinus TaxID=658057 RepID=UPI001C06BF9D|nr:Hpt domain-containing protein [Pacificibacter marinus]MBU2867749.1 Hpt domain-containing protein [Pacificibacter marinus]
MINKKHSQTAIEQKLAQTLERTKQRFIVDLNHKIAEIETIQILIQNETERQNALARLAFITHRFSGIAATLGLQSIGDCAAEIEQQIASFIQTPTQLSILSGRIEKLLDLMEDAIVKAL